MSYLDIDLRNPLTRGVNMAYPNPFTDQDCAALTQLGISCHGTDELIKALKSCGMPMDEREEQNGWQSERCRLLKATFFPNVS